MIKESIIGYVGNDAKTVTISGHEYAGFDIAVNNSKKETLWISVLCKIELLNYIRKGERIYVFGEPRFKIYESNGAVKLGHSLFASTIEFCGKQISRDDNHIAEEPAKQAFTKNELDRATEIMASIGFSPTKD